MWATKLNLACLLMDRSVHKLITTIPTGTHQLPTEEPPSHGTTVYGLIPHT